ncbi:MAG TPA: hypothetical protein VK797_28800 [Tepidisphaeraceae bacterium]|nr:hypothetical protein [Tepidisphaeraceae bacterium]
MAISPPLLAEAELLRTEFGEALPERAANIFQRIIRDPRAGSANARERECTEMLASVLINAPIIRERVFRWMAIASNTDPKLIATLDLELRTEQPIGSKRDDLRIEGWQILEEKSRRRLLWTVEVKVGASFHYSSDDRVDDASDPEEKVDEELVNQLVNYDAWLRDQTADNRRGFVLSVRYLHDQLPKLLEPWTCLTWTGLGTQLESTINDDCLPPDQLLLAKHLLGFIKANLWRSSEMLDSKLDFNDIALIRAFSVLGRECELKINRLVGTLEPVIAKSGIGYGDVKLRPNLYGQGSCCWIERRLLSTEEDAPYFGSSIGCDQEFGDYASVDIWFSPKHPRRQELMDAISEKLPLLTKRDPRWTLGSPVAADWTALYLWRPLTDFLSEPEQEKALASFVSSATEDLKAIDVQKLVSDVVGVKRKPISSA